MMKDAGLSSCVDGAEERSRLLFALMPILEDLPTNTPAQAVQKPSGRQKWPTHGVVGSAPADYKKKRGHKARAADGFLPHVREQKISMPFLWYGTRSSRESVIVWRSNLHERNAESPASYPFLAHRLRSTPRAWFPDLR